MNANKLLKNALPKKTISEIARYVRLGLSQSASNCRILLTEIERLRRENNKLRNQMLEMLAQEDVANHSPSE